MPSPLRSHALSLAALAAALLGCAPRVAPEPWQLPIEEGADAIVLPPVSSREREGRILELVAERTLGRAATEGSPVLLGSRPPQLALADGRRLVVLDVGNHRVLVLDESGDVLQTVGRQGQGPAEIGQGLDVVVHEDVLSVLDVRNLRWNRWRLDGTPIESVRLAKTGSQAAAAGPDSLIWRETFRTPERTDVSFRRVGLDGELRAELVRVRWPERTFDPPLAEIADSEPDAWWVGKVPPAHVAGPDGRVYASTNERYQVYAYEPDGRLRWALQRPTPVSPISSAEIDHFMAIHQRRFPRRTAAQVDWPETEYALSHLAVDGHGHLYVFPYSPRGTPADRPRAVDVYSAEGEPLWSGWMTGRIFETAYASYNGPMLEHGWQAAAGDALWGIAIDPATEEFEIVQYRLDEPF